MKLNPKYKLNLVTSDDETRKALTCVSFTGSHLVASNGFTMAIVPAEEGESGEPCLIPAKVYAAAVKGKKAHVTVADGTAYTVDKNGATFTMPILDAQFPNTKPMRADMETAITDHVFRVSLNAKLLKDLADAMGAETHQVTLYFEAAGFKEDKSYVKAVAVTTNDDKHGSDGNPARGLIMPVKC
jgi:hypothetical protein